VRLYTAVIANNAIVTANFACFKKCVTQRTLYAKEEDAKTAIFNFIEMFYNPIKRCGHTGDISSLNFEEDYFFRLESV